jgi:hypothetical protein
VQKIKPCTPPVVSSINLNPTACVGQNASVAITATSAAGTNSYQWYFAGSQIGTNNATLQVSNVTEANAGKYWVTIKNTCGTIPSDTIRLTVRPATIIETQPQPVSKCQGTNASFSVTANGQGTLNYQWKKGNTNVGINSPTLNLNNITQAMAGNYTVTISSGCGLLPSQNALLTVQSATSIPQSPVSQTVCAGSVVTYSVSPAGTGPFSYQWKKNGANIGIDSSKLILPYVISEDASTAYRVVVTGPCGSATSSAFGLTVNTVSPVITISGNTLSTSTVGTYQWLDCNTAPAIIQGQTSSSFSPVQSGSYTVQVTSSQGCLGTTDCVDFIFNSTHPTETKTSFLLSPNPTQDQLCIEWLGFKPGEKLEVFNNLGQKVLSELASSPILTVNTSRLSKGMYTLRIGNGVRSFVKE